MMGVVVVMRQLRLGDCGGFLGIWFTLTLGISWWIGELHHAVIGELSVKASQFAQNRGDLNIIIVTTTNCEEVISLLYVFLEFLNGLMIFIEMQL